MQGSTTVKIHCTQRAHDRLESRASAGKSYRPIIGATQNRCDGGFIRLARRWLSRPVAV
jgi:hypothetical protein